jgi:hypothetical protein
MLVIEHYYKLGVLNKFRNRWSAEDRLRVALNLFSAFRQAGLGVRAIDLSKIRVDSSYKDVNEIALYAEDRFRRAIKTLPQDTLEVVNRVVIINDIIKGCFKKREKEKEKLCRGLDALCDFYSERSKQWK